MKKEKPIIIKFNFSKYYFEDKDLIYYTDKIIYKYEELFPKSKGYENPLKIKKLKLISIERIESLDNIFGDLEKEVLYKYRLWFIDKKGKIYNPLAGEGMFIYCSDDELRGKYNIDYTIKKTRFNSLYRLNWE
jgi:hypothetical protein